jgi:hypothetical protein
LFVRSPAQFDAEDHLRGDEKEHPITNHEEHLESRSVASDSVEALEIARPALYF